jgi:diguanylate cyclase (GGDEF)-like protein
MASAYLSAEFSRCLDAIVELTRHKDPQELVTSLLQVLRPQLQAQRVRILTISNENHDTEFHEANIAGAVLYDLVEAEADAPVPLSADADLVECVRTQCSVVRDTPAGRRIVFPIFGAHHLWALFVVDGWRDDMMPQELVAKLLRVFSNQTFMLSRTQVDPLTGLYNRQSFYDRIRRLTLNTAPRRRKRDSSKLRGNCFALVDIDFFKLVNDRYGHIYGDEVLLLLARLMTRSFRHDDLLFRYGGEEFAVVLVNIDLETAEPLLDRFRAAVASYEFPRLEPKTVSIGVTRINVEQGVDKVVMCADKALYYAKNNGRNQVCVYEKLVAAGKLEPVTVAEGDIELF